MGTPAHHPSARKRGGDARPTYQPNVLHEYRLAREDVVGETWRLGLVDGYVGAAWWCWGNLADTHLSSWHEGMLVSQRPQLSDDWVLGLHLAELVFEDQSEDGTFLFVEGCREILISFQIFISSAPNEEKYNDIISYNLLLNDVC